MNRTEHHTTVSDLPFTVQLNDLPIVNQYQGNWGLDGDGEVPENYWIVTIGGKGHPMPGYGSPQQLIDKAKEMGWDCAYVAPYGKYVVGELDGVQLVEWLQDHRKKKTGWSRPQ